MSFFSQLLTATAEAKKDFEQIETLQRGIQGEISLATYQIFLTQAYYHVRHTTPLLMACGSRLPQSHEWLRNAVAEYIEEEVGHQEWILDDLAVTGADSQKIRHGQPHLTTELMVAYAYDTIMRNNPVGFFGMVLVLEGSSVSFATHAAKNIQTKLKLTEKAFSYLNSHGSLDIEHMDFFKNLMNKVKDKSDQQAIIHAANIFYKLYGDIFRAIPLD
ncbi:MAG: iron-containing redox enzyme family protein [gamma proteobacterium symbiont of Taylorina sp.]|nr:iron-containing redox enzyme family protein [gamma proteobacterium symbiont of Taylorina sp.]